MKIHAPLDKILDSEIKVKILRFLSRTDAEWNGRQIAKEIRISPASCHKALRELNLEGVLLFRTIGKSFLYRINKGNTVVAELLRPLYEAEGKIPQVVFNIIKRNLSASAKGCILSLAVFGSVARGRETGKSDIDVLVLLAKRKNEAAVAKEFEQISQKITVKFGNSVSPYFQGAKEFKAKYIGGVPLVKEIVKSHNLLYGKPLRESL